MKEKIYYYVLTLIKKRRNMSSSNHQQNNNNNNNSQNNNEEFTYLDFEKIKVQKSLSNDVCLNIDYDILNGTRTHIKINGFQRKNYALKYCVSEWTGLNFLLIEMYRQNDKFGPVVKSVHDPSMSSSVKISKLFLPVKEVLLILESMTYLQNEFMKIYESLKPEEQGEKIIKTEVQLADEKEKYLSLEGSTFQKANYKYFLDLSDVKSGLKNSATYTTFVGNYLLSIKDKFVDFDKNCTNNDQRFV